MLLQQLLARSGTCRLPGRALHNPFRRLQENRTNRDSHGGYDQAADLALNLCHVREKFLGFHFRDHDDVFRPEIGIVHAHRDHAAVMNGGMASDNFLNVLRINILTADNEQVFLPAHYIQFALQIEPELPDHELEFSNSWREAIREVGTERAQAAILLRPVSVEQIAEWARTGRRMPPKTTYFRPKPRTGMVFRTLDEPG